MPQAIPFIAGTLGLTAPAIGTAAFGSYLAGVAFASSALGSVVLQLGASVALSALSRALGPKPPQLIRDLQVPTSMPPKRFAYGAARISGSWAPLRTKGIYIYGCLILNSRPSDAVTGLLLDKRPVTISGDASDFSGPGATATAVPLAGLVNYWVGLGGQTAPPDLILSEAGDIFDATDGWQGRTVLWVRFSAGKNKSRATTWPATPPSIEVDGRWSKIWDPRNLAQDPDDPATWTWSDNQALCLLDALRENPIRQYRDRHLLLDTFAAAADVADQPVTLKAGGTEPRYRVGGVLIWDGTELLDQINPLAEAGAGTLIRAAQVGYAPGGWTDPVITLTDILDDQFEYQMQADDRNLPSAIKAIHVNPARDWQESELPPLPVPGASGFVAGEGVRDLPLPFVTSATQAMRIQQIRARQTGQQATLRATFAPIAFKALPGAVVQLDVPAPFERLNGLWRVTQSNPSLWLQNPDGGVAMRVAMTLVKTAAADYDFVPATDEFDLVVETFDPGLSGPGLPGVITAISGAAAALVSGVSVVPRVRFAFDPAPGDVLTYQVEFREGAGPWQSGGSIDADVRDGLDKVFGYVVPVTVGASYSVRVLALTSRGSSDWREVTGIVASAPASSLLPPTPVSISASGSMITASWSGSNDPNFAAAEIWAAYVDDFSQARQIAAPIYAAPSSLVSLATRIGMVPHDFRAGSSLWTGAAGGDPALVAAPSGLITYPVAAGVGPVARFTDVSAATAIALGSRAVIAPVASRTYRLTVRARIFGATTLGSNQAQLIFQQMDALYVAGTASVTDISFASDAWTELTATFSSGTPPAFLRPRFVKRSTWSDPTAQIEVAFLLLEDLTDGTTVYLFATALDRWLAASAPSTSLTETTSP